MRLEGSNDTLIVGLHERSGVWRQWDQRSEVPLSLNFILSLYHRNSILIHLLHDDRMWRETSSLNITRNLSSAYNMPFSFPCNQANAAPPQTTNTLGTTEQMPS